MSTEINFGGRWVGTRSTLAPAKSTKATEFTTLAVETVPLIVLEGGEIVAASDGMSQLELEFRLGRRRKGLNDQRYK